jgi:hypothetical protein
MSDAASVPSAVVQLGFKGAATPLGPDTVAAVARTIHVNPVHLAAVIAVETAGRPFDDQGRPAMLFEPHIFWRLLSKGSAVTLATAVGEGLAYQNWGEHPYPADSYPRLLRACELAETAALQSASWGLGQIMGGNFSMVGKPSVQAMVRAAMDSAAEQVSQMADFIVTAGLRQALRDGDWAAFARGYNGPGYAENDYDGKLARYVAAHAADVPEAATQVAPTPTPAPAPAAMTADELNAQELANLGGQNG